MNYEFDLGIGGAADALVDFMIDRFTPVLDGIADGIDFVADHVEDFFAWLPVEVMFLAVAALALWRVGFGFLVFSMLALVAILGMSLWDQTMDTLSLVVTAAVIAVAIGVPLGIVMAKSRIVATIVRPLLDLMQTMPAFVYLIPAAMFFGLGAVPGIIATVIFSMPPVVRLTNLGIRQVNAELVEAGLAFGCTGWQLLRKVQFPNALPSIMAGVNQTIMLGLSMVVIASMIGAGGLGNTVLTGIQRLDVGLGFEGGLAVVLLAVILDRITQGFGRPPALSFARLGSLFRRPTRDAVLPSGN